MNKIMLSIFLMANLINNCSEMTQNPAQETFRHRVFIHGRSCEVISYFDLQQINKLSQIDRYLRPDYDNNLRVIKHALDGTKGNYDLRPLELRYYREAQKTVPFGKKHFRGTLGFVCGALFVAIPTFLASKNNKKTNKNRMVP